MSIEQTRIGIWTEKIRSKYIGNYGNEIIDRFYDMSLDDRLKLIEKLIRLNNEIKSSEYGWQYTDHKKDLEIVKEVTSIIKKAEQFTEFYNSLTKEQQVSVISGILSIDEEDLDRYIEYRDKKRQEEKVKKLIK